MDVAAYVKLASRQRPVASAGAAAGAATVAWARAVETPSTRQAAAWKRCESTR
jgi:hypothetical protein